MALIGLLEAVRRARRVYLCGNGGSAANAVHIANDLISVGIRAQALTADIATLTAIANDFGYEQVFERQLYVFADPGDLLIALSGSGNSVNIVRAIDAARAMGLETWAIVGARGGAAWLRAEHAIREGDTMQEAEEAQVRLGHELMLRIKQERA